MTQIEQVMSFALPSYNHSFTQFDVERHALWHYLNPSPRPVFTQTLLTEMLDVQQRTQRYLKAKPATQTDLQYLVLASAMPGVFSLGGDLELFAHFIRNQDREGLTAYGKACIDIVFNYCTHVVSPSLTTIALVQGSALGGGFEAVLSNNVIVAERSSSLGLPEILFNLFPGMGAYSFLARRLGMAQAERLLSEGRQYSAGELYEMGIVDVLAEDGQGVRAVNTYIRQHSRSRNGLLAIQQVRERLAPITYKELEDIVMIWVDTALTIELRDLRTMERLISAQHRLSRRLGAIGRAARRENFLSYPSVA